jgi:hypothetical protein
MGFRSPRDKGSRVIIETLRQRLIKTKGQIPKKSVRRSKETNEQRTNPNLILWSKKRATNKGQTNKGQRTNPNPNQIFKFLKKIRSKEQRPMPSRRRAPRDWRAKERRFEKQEKNSKSSASPKRLSSSSLGASLRPGAPSGWEWASPPRPPLGGGEAGSWP